MGASNSKEEDVYRATQRGELEALKQLKQQGASLEWTDSKGRTALLLACSHPEGYDAAQTLLQLGANMRAYRPGPDGGFAVHVAARKGLDRTLNLLLQYGAQLMVVNDLGQTPLWLARINAKVSTVRLIEDRLSLFCGYMRQQMISAPNFVQALVKNWVTKMVWIVVLPITVDPRRPPKFELAIYASTQATVPNTTLALDQVDISIADSTSGDPILMLEDRVSHVKVRLQGGDHSNVSHAIQVQQAFNACRGIPQKAMAGVAQYAHPPAYNIASSMYSVDQIPPPLQSPATAALSPSSARPPTPTAAGEGHQKKFHISDVDEDAALKLALEESLKTAAAHKASYGGWEYDNKDSGASDGYAGWGGNAGAPARVDNKPVQAAASSNDYNGWDVGPVTHPVSSGVASQPAAPTTGSAGYPVIQGYSSVAGSNIVPSAPPLPPAAYPAPAADAPTEEQSGGNDMCVVCWSSPKQAACVPCGHMSCCMDCLSDIRRNKNECPVCRGDIKDVIKVFQV